MAKQQDWIGQIVQRPDEEGLRLEYAEWLEGQGDPRGEFIRLQCALSHLLPDDPPVLTFGERAIELEGWRADDPTELPFFGHRHWAPLLPNVARYCTHRRAILPEEGELRSMLQREEELLATHAEEWIAAIHPCLRGGVFRRGLIERARLSADRFFDLGGGLITFTTLREFILENLGTQGSLRLAKTEFLGQIKTLIVEGEPIFREGAVALLQSKYLRNIECLSLEKQELGGSVQDLFGEVEALPKLQRLNLSDNDLEYIDTAKKLGKARGFPNLRAVDLSGNRLWCELPTTLLNSKHLQLTELDFGDNGVDNRVIKLLATAPAAATLESLNLNQTQLTPANLKTLAGSTQLRKLKRLGFAGHRMSDKSLSLLFDSEILDNVEYLDLAANILTDKGVALLAASTHLTRLRELDLSGNKVTFAALDLLATADNLPSLRTLHLNHSTLNKPPKSRVQTETARLTTLNVWKSKLNERSAEQLIELPCLQRLEAIHLGGTDFGEVAVRALANLSHLTHLQLDHALLADTFIPELAHNLRSLHLANTGLRTVLLKGEWPHLETLDLSQCKLGAAGARVLASVVLPNLRTLNLQACDLGDDGVEALLEAPFITRLVDLNLADNGLTDRAAKLLTTCEHLRLLKSLTLHDQRFSSRLVRQLRGAANMPRLLTGDLNATLMLEGNPLKGSMDLEKRLAELAKRQPPLAGMNDASALARANSTCAWRSDFIGMICYTLNGWLAVSLNPAGDVALWETATGKVLRHWRITPCEGRVAVAPDARRLACVTIDGELHIWDLVTLRLLHQVPTEQGSVFSLAFAADNDTIATAGLDGTVAIWSVGKGKCRKRITCSKKALFAVALSPDGQTLAVNDDDAHVTLWNWQTGKRIRRLTGDSENDQMRVDQLQFSPDGDCLAAASRCLAVWRLSDSERLYGSHNDAASVFFTPDNRSMVTVDAQRWNQEIWDIRRGRQAAEVNESHATLLLASLLWLADDGTLMDEIPAELLAPATGKPDPAPSLPAPAVSRGGHIPDDRQIELEAPAFSAAVSSDLRLMLTGGEDETVRLWDVSTGELVRQWQLTSVVTALAFSPDDSIIVVGTDWGEIYGLDTTTGLRRFSYKNDNDTSQRIRFLPDGNTFFLMTDNSRPMILSAVTGERIRPFNVYGQTDLSADGTLFVTTGRDHSFSLRRVADVSEIREYKGHTNTINALALSPHGQLIASCSDDKTLRLWDLASDRELQRGKIPVCHCLRFTPNGRALVAADTKGTLHFWSVADLTAIHQLPLHRKQVRCLEWADEGRRVVTASEDRVVHLLKLNDALLRKIDTLPAPTLTVSPAIPAVPQFERPSLVIEAGQYSRAIWSPDGMLIYSFASEGLINIWDAKTGKRRTQWKVSRETRNLAVSPDGKMLYTCLTNGTLVARDLVRDENVYSTRMKEGCYLDLAISPDGKTLGIAASTFVAFHDAATGKVRSRGHGQPREVYCIAFSPDGSLAASGSVDHQVHLWDVASGTERVVAGQQYITQIHAVAFSPDGQTLATGDHGIGIVLWNLASMKVVKTLSGHAVDTLTFSPDGRFLFSGGSSSDLCIWDTVSGERLHQLKFHQWGISDLAVASDGVRLLSAARHGEVCVWDLTTFYTGQGYAAPPKWPTTVAASPTLPASNAPVLTVPHQYQVSAVAVLPDSRHAMTAGSEPRIHWWHLETGKMIHTWELRHGPNTLAVSPSGASFASEFGENTIGVWDLESKELRYKVRLETTHVSSIDWSRETNLIAVATGEGHLAIWDADNSKQSLRVWKKTPCSRKVIWLPDGRRLIRVGSPTVQLWDTDTEAVLQEFGESTKLYAWNVVLSPDGVHMAVVDEHSIHLIDLNSGRRLRILQSDHAFALAFSPDGQRLAASEHASINLWNVATGERAFTWRGHNSMPHCLAFSPDGEYLVSGGPGGGDCTAKVWRVPPTTVQ